MGKGQEKAEIKAGGPVTSRMGGTHIGRIFFKGACSTIYHFHEEVLWIIDLRTFYIKTGLKKDSHSVIFFLLEGKRMIDNAKQ